MRRFPRRYALAAFCAALLPTFSAFAQLTTVRDIYSTKSGYPDTYQAALSYATTGSQSVRQSTAPIYSAPYAWRIKLAAGSTRSAVGIRLTDAGGNSPVMLDVTAIKSTAGLQFYLNPKTTPMVPHLAVELVSDVSGTEVFSKVPLAGYVPAGFGGDTWTEVLIPFTAFPNTGYTGTGASATFSWTRVRGLNFACDTTASGFYDPSVDNVRFVDGIGGGLAPLTVQGQHFVNAAGQPVRFWGMNLAAVFPTHQQAEAMARNLAERQVNLVRWHHMLRKSLDWNVTSKIPALVDHVSNTRTWHTQAWDRFDYANLQLAENGIYTCLSLDSSRRYLPGDVDILTTNSTDRTNWMNAVTALSGASIDLVRMLPMFDERAAKLMEEHTTRLLTRVNPYTGKTYGQDPQVIYLEVMNETSSEYAILAGNTFPAGSYFDLALQARWTAYTTANSIPACNLYSPGTTAQKTGRSEFLRGLDLAYFNRMKAFVTGLGVNKPITFSNLWRGESFQKLHADHADIIEDHQYKNPFVANSLDDVVRTTTRSAIVGKPYFLGEFNQREAVADLTAGARYRGMLQVAAALYGGLQDWSGVTWFAWQHGDFLLGDDGWSVWEERDPANISDIIGRIMTDGAQLDHLRTTGLIFRRGLASPGLSQKVLYVDAPHVATSYNTLITPKYDISAGWQSIYRIRRAFGTVPAGQATQNWMSTVPANPQVSDTNQISKDTTRKQITFSVPAAEAFSGLIDASAPAKLTRLKFSGHTGMATVVAVSKDGATSLNSANEIIVSRTSVNSAGADIDGPVVTLKSLAAASGGMVWHIQRTRPRGETGYTALTMNGAGELVLPATDWNECELRRAAAGSLPPVQSIYQTGDTMLPIFDDGFVLASTTLGLTSNAQFVVDPAATFVPAEGTHSLRMKLTAGQTLSQLGMSFVDSTNAARPLDLAGDTADLALTFWVYPKRDVASFNISVCSNKAGVNRKASLPLTTYIPLADRTNKWVKVTIPLTHFTQTLDWDSINGVAFSANTAVAGYYDPCIDDLRLTYD